MICKATVYDRVPSWPCPAGSLDRPRRCKRQANPTGFCTQHARKRLTVPAPARERVS